MKRPKEHSREAGPERRDPAMLSPYVSHDAIACRAHARFVQRGGTHGQDVDDWLAAEQELREEFAGSTRP